MGRPADQARDRVHHQGAHGAVAGARRRHASTTSSTRRSISPTATTIPPSTKPGRGTFAKSPPTLDIIPCIEHGLAPYDGKIEINVLALKPGGATKRRAIDAGVPTAFRHQPQAMKAGDLLFMSGLMAFDGHGLAPRPPATRASRSFRHRRRRRPNSSSATSPSSAKPPARRSPMSCACCSSTPTSASSIRSTRSGSAASAAVRCRSPRSRCRRRCRCRARRC